MATETEPNGAVTRYTHDERGNVPTMTNALGHVTSHVYDNANRLISTTAPNGQITTYAWDTRDRLLRRSVGAHTTAFAYTPFGAVESVSLPSGLVLTYSYDPAQRLVGWRNSRGEFGTFSLDAMGNRVGEQVSDTSGAIAWSAARSINRLNRVGTRTEGSDQTSSFAYGPNGELVASTNALNQSTRWSLDALRRVSAITDAANASASLRYDTLDGISQASDFKGVATRYDRDAQGNATSESSPDIGTRITEYDALGLPQRIVDALGQATRISRDALGRPTSIAFADGKVTTLVYDSPAAGKGFLSSFTDRSGTTSYLRDIHGRVAVKSQRLANGSTQTVGYAFNPNGTLASIVYPSGGTLGHLYDATGQLVQLNWTGRPLVTDLRWNALGQPTAWNWAFVTPTLTASRRYDNAGRLTSTEFSRYAYDAAGRISALTQQLYGPADANPTNSSIAALQASWTVGYDPVGRITRFSGSVVPLNARGTRGEGSTQSSTTFAYDTNGNRTASTRSQTGQSEVSRSYSVSANQLTGFTQSTGGAATSVAYTLNANGDLTSDGLKTFSYDAEGRLAAVTTGATDSSPTTRYAHNALGQRVFKTEPLYPPSRGDQSNPGLWQNLAAFFTQLWNPANPAEQLGFAYVYAEDGTLIAEAGSGGAFSSGSTQYIYLPTTGGPMPIAAMVNGQMFAVHSDHLNTPRRLTNDQGQAVWQWAYSAFGDEEPTTASKRFTNEFTTPSTGSTAVPPVVFNLGYWGMYRDQESRLAQNWHRYYDGRTGRYIQPDPIGLAGGWNRLPYAENNPLLLTDPTGLCPACLAVPIVGGGVALTDIGIGAALGGALIGIDRMFSKPNVNDPQARLEHDAYKDRSLQTPPPNHDECERLKWLLQREQDVVQGMQAWDAKWVAGRHAEAISQRLRGIERLKQQISKNCGNC